jgi:hypothetical protein
MPSPPPRSASPPFASRELNGEVLLDALAELRNAQVGQQQLNDCVAGLRDLEGLRLSEVVSRLRSLAGRFSGHPALASLLVRWAGRLKSEADVPLLLSHLERLALASALIAALRRGQERLPRGGR